TRSDRDWSSDVCSSDLPFDVNGPAITLQQHMDPAISVSHPGLADVLDPTFESGLVAALGLVDVKCAIDAKGRTGPPDRNLPLTRSEERRVGKECRSPCA